MLWAKWSRTIFKILCFYSCTIKKIVGKFYLKYFIIFYRRIDDISRLGVKMNSVAYHISYYKGNSIILIRKLFEEMWKKVISLPNREPGLNKWL